MYESFCPFHRWTPTVGGCPADRRPFAHQRLVPRGGFEIHDTGDSATSVVVRKILLSLLPGYVCPWVRFVRTSLSRSSPTLMGENRKLYSEGD